jgi:pSer/pThr/pTyr-binding forkhead associated (FHA) protein
MSQLVFKFKDKILGGFSLIDRKKLTIGRHQSNDIVIDNLAVSGYHARVEAKQDGFVICDLQSKNGTFLNNDPVTEAYLNHKDIISIGKHSFVVDLMDEIDADVGSGPGTPSGGAQSSFSDDQTMALDTPNEHRSRGEEAAPEDTIAEPFHPERDILYFLQGGEGELELSQKAVSIGINEDADIVISGLWSIIVGGPAATISKQAGEYFLRYNGGLIKPKRNGVSVKGTVKLNHQDIVDVGPVKLQIQLSQRIFDQ